MIGRRLSLMAVAGLSVLSLSGCIDLKGGRDRDSTIAAATTWPFVPTSMRISPFTAIGYDAQKQTYVLDLMVELRDRVGDLTKGVGEFDVELRRAANGGEGALLYAWAAPMLTVEQNVQHYNPALSTYNLKLALDAPLEPGQTVTVIARFTDPGGKRLKAAAQVTADADDADG